MFFRAVWRLPVVVLQVRLFGLRPFQAAQRRAHDGPQHAWRLEEVLVRARQAQRFVLVAARYGVCRGNCLSRSLCLWWLLREQGIESDLRIGVRNPDGGFAAHAWIEYQGIVLNDRADVGRQFAPFEPSILSERVAMSD
jgi:Transglutaminase-like superfamily